MPLTDPPPYAFHRKFVDFDELAEEAHHWDLDLFQHGRGAFRGELVQFGIRNIHISEARFCRPLLQKGTPPAGLRTIAVPAHQKVHLSWRGMQVSGNDLMIFPRGGELAATSNLDFHVYTCSFPEILLTSFNDEFGPSELDDLRGDASVLHCRISAIQSVRECLSQLSAVVRDDAARQFADKILLNLATQELPARLLTAIATAHTSSSPKPTRKRELALLRAESYVKQYASEDISVRDICRAAQVSQRTLEYTFVERFGLAPKAFLIAYRLNATRRELRMADPTETKVADIGNRWGFWHMGQFAASYRKQFGELPSETLRRVNA
ncbi:MAG: helix-turn-helix domain-containing protein [Rubripirellula sp.]|nr:helix-turn-helix domain-containing protein [Rubripirellula sp.]